MNDEARANGRGDAAGPDRDPVWPPDDLAAEPRESAGDPAGPVHGRPQPVTPAAAWPRANPAPSPPPWGLPPSLPPRRPAPGPAPASGPPALQPGPTVPGNEPTHAWPLLHGSATTPPPAAVPPTTDGTPGGLDRPFSLDAGLGDRPPAPATRPSAQSAVPARPPATPDTPWTQLQPARAAASVPAPGPEPPAQRPPAQHLPAQHPPTDNPRSADERVAVVPLHPGVVEVPPPGVYPVPRRPAEPPWAPDAGVPTADDFARRRVARPSDPSATTGFRAAVNKLGVVKLPPSRDEQEMRQDVETVRRNFGGLRQVTVVNPKGGAGKTVAILLLAMTFGQKRGGYVLAWDNNETQGTLGMRAQQDFHARTVRDLLRDLGQFRGAHGRVGDLSQYVRAQGEGMFDVLASDESATAGEMLTAQAFADIRDVVSRFYKLIFVDTGNNVRAQNWQAATDATDQLVVTMSARNDSAETAARMLDHLEQTGRHRLVRQAVTVVSMPPSRRDIDLPPIQRHFAARTRAVLLAPYERLIDSGEPIRYSHLSAQTRAAWLKIAAAVAEGL